MNAKLTPADEDAIAELLRRGEKIEAIKFYGEKTGAGLAEAKQAVEQFTVNRGTQPRARGVEKTAVIHELQRDGMLAAIKEYRAQTGCGLREAKLAVDEIARREGIVPRNRGCLGVAAIIVTLAGAAAVAARALE
jgi:ribosomal protein L7/L12